MTPRGIRVRMWLTSSNLRPNRRQAARIGHVALYHPAAGSGHRNRRLATAAILCDGAAWMEAAAGRDVGGIRQRVAEADIGDAEAGIWRQHTGQQRLGVGMARRAEQRLGGAPLDEAAELHHRDLAGHV